MPYKSDSISISNPLHDKRIKLSDKQKDEIREEYKSGVISQRALAEKYKVSRRTIQFVIDPEKLERQKQLYAERRKDGRYYDKEKHTKAVREHRNHKNKLFKEGKI